MFHPPGIRLLLLKFVLKLIGCLLYVVEAVYLDYRTEDKNSNDSDTTTDQ